MSNLTESPQWEEGIYQIETSDPVLAGPDGISNVQAKQLGNRTAYLKQQVEAAAASATSGIAGRVAKAGDTMTGPLKSPGINAFGNLGFGGSAAAFSASDDAHDKILCRAAAGGGMSIDAVLHDNSGFAPMRLNGTTLTWNGQTVWHQANFDPSAKQAALGYVPVQQGTGIAQTSNAVKIGWSAIGKLKATVDSTDIGPFAMTDAPNTFTGSNDFAQSPTVPTPAAGDNSNKASSTAFVQAAIAALVNSSPAALDTLKELADALGDDPSFAATVNTAIAARLTQAQGDARYLQLLGGALSGQIKVSGNFDQLLINNTSGDNSSVVLQNNGAEKGRFHWFNGGNTLYSTSAGHHAWVIGASEVMRLSSSNGCLGVGTNSPQARIHAGTTTWSNPGASPLGSAFMASGSFGGGYIMNDAAGYGGSWMDSSGTRLLLGIGTSAGLTTVLALTTSAITASVPVTVIGALTASGNITAGNGNSTGETTLTLGSGNGYFFTNPTESGFNTPGSVDGYWTYNRSKKNLTVSGWDVWHTGLIASSLAQTGYRKLPDGSIEQWGITNNLSSETYQDIVFPTAFPNACFNVQATVIATDASDDQGAMTGTPTKNGVRIFRGTFGGAVSEMLPVFWRAIGN